MDKLNLYIFTEDVTPIITFTIDNNSFVFLAKFASIFDIDLRTNHEIVPIIINDIRKKELLKMLQEASNYYGKRILKIYSLLSDIEDDKKFSFAVTSDEFEEELIDNIQIQLKFMNMDLEGIELIDAIENYIKLKDEIDTKFLSKYNMIHYDGSKTVKIGEQDKKKRVCRFCGKSIVKGKSFNSIAHVIPESLGNKKIFCHDECDQCNGGLIKTLEDSLGSYLEVFKTTWHVKGKRGVPKIKSKDGNLEIISLKNNPLLENNEEIKNILSQIRSRPEVLILQRNSDGSKIDPFNIKYQSTNKINPQDIYRAFCKMAIEIVPAELLNKLEFTNRFIHKDVKLTKLPKIAMTIHPELFLKHPEISLYYLKQNDENLPKIVIEIEIWTYAFVCIVPTSENEITDYLSEEKYKKYFDTFYFYKGHKWNFEDFSLDELRDFNMNIHFNQEDTSLENEKHTPS
ncbi:HNH endonuclease [Spirochaeta cellobiosiphila]|uniref:HNH endonuclease n=1 Tax=Spirochaeta cellobiosiphila TaxID=504483 RepID=UPI0004153AEA|nr:HNH endonuclease [Spirochaeta cellobiosiphila]